MPRNTNFGKLKNIQRAKAKAKAKAGRAKAGETLPEDEPTKKYPVGPKRWEILRGDVLMQLQAIEYREEHGAFPDIEFEKIKNLFTPTFLLSEHGISKAEEYGDTEVLALNSRMSIKRTAYYMEKAKAADRRSRRVLEKKFTASQATKELESMKRVPDSSTLKLPKKKTAKKITKKTTKKTAKKSKGSTEIGKKY